MKPIPGIDPSLQPTWPDALKGDQVIQLIDVIRKQATDTARLMVVLERSMAMAGVSLPRPLVYAARHLDLARRDLLNELLALKGDSAFVAPSINPNGDLHHDIVASRARQT